LLLERLEQKITNEDCNKVQTKSAPNADRVEFLSPDRYPTYAAIEQSMRNSTRFPKIRERLNSSGVNAIVSTYSI
jgi:hypothetical protein